MENLWKTIGASVPGATHKNNEVLCQDAHAYLELTEGLLIAVADGAGTAAHSAEAAECAVREVIAFLKHFLESENKPAKSAYQNMMVNAFAAAREAILSIAKTRRIPPRELACTLTAIIAANGRLVTAQIGDCAAVAGTGGDRFFSITEPQRGEYANETYFLTGEDALQRMVTSVYEENIKSLAVMSDGLTHLALYSGTKEPHTQFFKPLVEFVSTIKDQETGDKKLKDFLVSPRVCRRTHDDKTLVIAVQTGAGS